MLTLLQRLGQLACNRRDFDVKIQDLLWRTDTAATNLRKPCSSYYRWAQGRRDFDVKI